MDAKDTIKIIELFSGIGAPKKALGNLNIKSETLFISEINNDAVEAYKMIFNNDVKNIGNILNFQKKDIEKYRNKCDVLVFGSPCQDFSQGGKNLGGNKGTNTRSSLLWSAVEIISLIKPKIILFENVKNILSPKHVNVLNEYINSLNEMSYFSTNPLILNAKDYGIPQNRERVFIVSFLNDSISRDKFNSTNWVSKRKETITLDKFLKIENFKDRELCSNKIEYDKWKNFATWKSPSGNINGSYNRAWKINSYCGTLNVCNVIKITDGSFVSKLTPKESWLLMGFTEKDYNNVSLNSDISVNSLYKLAGNSIVVNVLEEIFNEIFI